MRMRSAALPILIGLLAGAAPVLADSVSVSSGPNGTTVVNGKPCRVVTTHDGNSNTNSTSVTAGGGNVSGSTTVSPGSSGSSVSVGSSASSDGAQSSSAGGSDCVIYRNEK
jgi:hypothetical protein